MPAPHRCWSQRPWAAQDIWAARVRQGDDYWKAMIGVEPIMLLDTVTLPLAEPGCGEGCTCVGGPLFGTEATSSLLWPRTWYTATAFPNGAWCYDVSREFCGPYVLLDGTLDTTDYWSDLKPVPTGGFYGIEVTLPDEDGTYFVRTIRPVWDVVVVPHAHDPEYATDPVVRLFHQVRRTEDIFTEMYQSLCEDIAGDDDVESVERMVAAIAEELEVERLSGPSHYLERMLEEQRIDWAWMLGEVNDECSHLQSRLLVQQRLAS